MAAVQTGGRACRVIVDPVDPDIRVMMHRPSGELWIPQL